MQINYPSTTSCYYATGAWYFGRAQKAECSVAAQNPPTITQAVNGFVQVTFSVLREPFNDPRTFFIPNYHLAGRVDAAPTEVTDFYTLQAPIPNNVDILRRISNITCNSGKFLVFIPSSKINDAWIRFKAAYNAGLLGYGLQCSTATDNPNCSPQNVFNQVITVFVRDSFDSRDVATVAWQINRLLSPWQGTLQFMTDRGTKARSGQSCNGEGDMLYSISSFSFIVNAINGGTQTEPLDNFVSKFQHKFMVNAQMRQNVLAHKRNILP